jgi:3-dehydrosphinganine reductase
MKEFKNKIVYISGGSSGIGLAAAKLMAARGASVAIFARRQKLLDDALGEISACRVMEEQKFNCRSLDVSVREQVEEVLKNSVAEYGVPDVLINCAATGSSRKPLRLTFTVRGTPYPSFYLI